MFLTWQYISIKEFFFYMWIINLLAFAVYAFDKHQAHYCKWRVPEAVLIFLAVIGGAFGAGAAMLIFRHKTRKPLFRIVIPIFIVLAMVLAFLIRYDLYLHDYLMLDQMRH